VGPSEYPMVPRIGDAAELVANRIVNRIVLSLHVASRSIERYICSYISSATATDNIVRYICRYMGAPSTLCLGRGWSHLAERRQLPACLAWCERRGSGAAAAPSCPRVIETPSSKAGQLVALRRAVEAQGTLLDEEQGALLDGLCLDGVSNDKQCLDPGIWILAHLGP
jgi:hypothetical protein